MISYQWNSLVAIVSYTKVAIKIKKIKKKKILVFTNKIEPFFFVCVCVIKTALEKELEKLGLLRFA